MCNQKEALKNISMLDFMAMDLSLYLDTHIDDKKALALYNCVAEELAILKADYAKQYGPLQGIGMPNPSECDWIWASGQWPWQEEYNYKL